MTPNAIDRLQFHDGRRNPIDRERMFDFETKAVLNRYYAGREIDAGALLDDLGPFQMDFADVLHWGGEIPDINEKSARLFSLWADDKETKEIITIVHGFFVVMAFGKGKAHLKDYYYFDENVPYFPISLVTSLRTTIHDELDQLLDRILEEIGLNWQKRRIEVMNDLEEGSELWQRYSLCLDRILHFVFLCPSIDRELIDSLRKKDYQTTGVMQLLASPPTEYNIEVDSYLKTARRLQKDRKEE